MIKKNSPYCTESKKHYKQMWLMFVTYKKKKNPFQEETRRSGYTFQKLMPIDQQIFKRVILSHKLNFNGWAVINADVYRGCQTPNLKHAVKYLMWYPKKETYQFKASTASGIRNLLEMQIQKFSKFMFSTLI